MGKSDKITFWVFELLIWVIVLILHYGAMSHQYCGTYLAEHPEIAENVSIMRAIRVMSLLCLGLIATMGNLVALYAARFRFLPNLPMISKVFFRICIFITVFSIFSGLLILFSPCLDHWI